MVFSDLYWFFHYSFRGLQCMLFSLSLNPLLQRGLSWLVQSKLASALNNTVWVFTVAVIIQGFGVWGGMREVFACMRDYLINTSFLYESKMFPESGDLSCSLTCSRHLARFLVQLTIFIRQMFRENVLERNTQVLPFSVACCKISTMNY